MNQIKVSAEFRKKATKAILSIILFVFAYLIMILLSIILTCLCALAGMAIIAFKPMAITIALGVGCLSLGLFVLFFLFKFVTKKHISDRSHLVEIKKEEQPELFNFIYGIAKEVKTSKPKKVYLSADVNASVFYDSSFLSLFLPVKKNLQIGMGLVNSVSEAEFKAILAHEFGHFSQSSMKVGSYVYQVNNVIYNLLFENESYDLMMNKWANAKWYLAIFVKCAEEIIKVIKWALKKLYNVVNLSYMQLSREMEYHADAIAASVAGSGPMKTALLRLDLADQSYNAVLNYYSDKIEDCIRSQNIYPEQSEVMSFVAKENNLQRKNSLPLVSEEFLKKFNKSKLRIENEWASHPSTTDRIHALDQLNLTEIQDDYVSANRLFNSIETVQSKITDNIFKSIQYKNPVILNSKEKFAEEYIVNKLENSFDKRYAGYYDDKNPVILPIDTLLNSTYNDELSVLLNQENTAKVYAAISLGKDIESLQQIAKGDTGIKQFNYDGIKYSEGDAALLIVELQKDLEKVQKEIAENDKHLFVYFLNKAKEQNREEEFLGKYRNLYYCDAAFDKKLVAYINLSRAVDFINVTTPFSVIEKNLEEVYELEKEFKNEIKELLNDSLYQDAITDEIRENFEKYLSRAYIYFIKPDYDNENLKILFAAINGYYNVLSMGLYLKKKELLNFQIELLDRIEPQILPSRVSAGTL